MALALCPSVLLVFHSFALNFAVSGCTECVKDTAHSTAFPRPTSGSHFSHVCVSACQRATQYLKIRNIAWITFANTDYYVLMYFGCLANNHVLVSSALKYTFFFYLVDPNLKIV